MFGLPLAEISVFTPFVKNESVKEYTVDPEGRLINPANVLSASRPLLAARAAQMLIQGKRGVTPVVVAMAATDWEGNVARALDKYFPDLHIGTSEIGPEADQYADAAALLTVSLGALLAPRVSLAGKSAVGMVLGQEGMKLAWALRKSTDYAAATNGDRLVVPSSVVGKYAMAEKLIAVSLAVATNDVDPGGFRTALGTGAVTFAALGSARGAYAIHGRGGYNSIVTDQISQIRLAE